MIARPALLLAPSVLALASLAALPPHAAAAGGAKAIRLHVVAGQSNTVGVGADPNLLPAALGQPSADVPFWFVVGPHAAIADPSLRLDSGGGFVPLAPQHDPSGATFGPTLAGFGPELLLGRTLALEDDAPVAVLKFAFNGSDLAQDWNSLVPGSLYHQLLVEIGAARAVLESQGATVELASFCWMQGESDALDAADAWSYEWNLELFVERLRADLGAPGLPVVIGRLNQFIDGPNETGFPYLYEVRDAQLAVHALAGATHLVDTDRFTRGSDEVHFDAWGQVELGRHFAHAVLGQATTYCSSQVSSNGCVPAIGSLGVPSLSSPAGFHVVARELQNQRTGLLFYGFEPESAPLLGGTLCVRPPLHRTPPRSTGGSTSGLDCTGSLSLDVTALVRLGADPELTVGRTVYAQAWYRDPGALFGSGLTDALSFVLTP